VKVHKLGSTARSDVILPEKTIQLLERNVSDFIAHRDALRDLGMATKKGLLFYGAPGTGKTHTIRYLASQLPNHTTLLITAEQVGLLDEYFQLARFLQPAMVVIEDVDLIARAREQMRSACEESLLNRLQWHPRAA
jgi:ATP-dependent 26S proteasome regulatory subunit